MNLLTLVTAAADYPVTTAEVKADLRIQHSAEDDLIEDYIAAATEYCQEVVGKKLVEQVWDYSIALPDGYGRVYFPLLPIAELISLRYYDLENAEQTLDLDDFYFYQFEDMAYIEPKTNIDWPSVYDRRDAITIQFKAGTAAALVAPNIKRAIRLLVAHWYECRTAATIGVEVKEVPMGVNNLLGISRVGWVA
jgi:uncharacterized phiE125 gp8 family phage protein